MWSWYTNLCLCNPEDWSTKETGATSTPYPFPCSHSSVHTLHVPLSVLLLLWCSCYPCCPWLWASDPAGVDRMPAHVSPDEVHSHLQWITKTLHLHAHDGQLVSSGFGIKAFQNSPNSSIVISSWETISNVILKLTPLSCGNKTVQMRQIRENITL